MSDNVAEIKISADASGAQSGMRQASASVREGVDQIKGHLKGLSDAFGKVNVAMASIGAVLAGGAAFGAAVNETVNLTKESIALGKQFGISASEASVLKLALGDVYVSQEAMQAAGNKITQTLRTNEKAFGALGVATRDSTGHLRGTFEVMQDVNKRLLQFKEGTDRNIEGQKIYGRQWAEISGTLKLTKQAMDEAREKATALYLVVGQESVDANNRYLAAMNDVDDVFSAVKKSIGDALLPVLSSLGEWFASIGPTLIKVLRGALVGLGTAFYTLKLIIADVFDAIKTAVANMVTRLASFAQAAERALHFDGQGALAAWREGTRKIEENSSEFGKRIVSRLTETQEKVKDLFGRMMNPETATAAPKAGRSSAGDTSKIEARKDNDGKWYAELQRQLLAETERVAREDERIQMDSVNTKRAIRLIELSDAHSILKAQVEAGEISKAQELRGDMELERRRYKIEQDALAEREAVSRADLVTHNAVLNDIKIAQAEHGQRMAEIDRTSRAETQRSWRETWGNVQQGFQQVLSSFFRGALTLKDLFRGLAASIVGSFADMAAKNIATMLAQAAAGKSIRLGEIAGNAKAAAAGAYKAIVGIPYVGPFLAPPAAAAAFAGVMAFASAEGGYDIPAGVNPLVQTHAREMILPAKQADVIRNMADNGTSGGGHTFNITIPAIDGASTKSWLRNGGDRQIADALRRHLKV